MHAFTRSILPGYPRIFSEGAMWPLHVTIRYSADGTLGISGVHGAQRNGECIGSAGQCVDVLSDIKADTLAPGWDLDMVARLRNTWERWHLNDMRPNCEHQVGPEWDARAPITLYTYRLNLDLMRAQRAAERGVLTTVKSGERVDPSDLLVHLLSLPFEIVTDGDAENGPDATEYSLKSQETKSAGNVYPTEHPGGILTKPCNVCGYKYGTAWKKEEVPADVLEWLASLPEASEPNPWDKL